MAQLTISRVRALIINQTNYQPTEMSRVVASPFRARRPSSISIRLSRRGRTEFSTSGREVKLRCEISYRRTETFVFYRDVEQVKLTTKGNREQLSPDRCQLRVWIFCGIVAAHYSQDREKLTHPRSTIFFFRIYFMWINNSFYRVRVWGTYKFNY